MAIRSGVQGEHSGNDPLSDMLFFTKPFAFDQLLAAIRRLVPTPTTSPRPSVPALLVGALS